MRWNTKCLAFHRVPNRLADKADELLSAFEFRLDFAQPFELHSEHVRLWRGTAAEDGSNRRKRLFRQTFE